MILSQFDPDYSFEEANNEKGTIRIGLALEEGVRSRGDLPN